MNSGSLIYITNTRRMNVKCKYHSIFWNLVVRLGLFVYSLKNRKYFQSFFSKNKNCMRSTSFWSLILLFHFDGKMSKILWRENVEICRSHFPCHHFIDLVILFSNRTPQINTRFETAWRVIKISIKHWGSQSHYQSAVSNSNRWSNWIFIRFDLIHISLLVQADFCNSWLSVFEFACWCHFRIGLRISIDLLFNCMWSNIVLPLGKICWT